MVAVVDESDPADAPRRRTSAGSEICPLEVIFMVGMCFTISTEYDMINA